MPWIDTHCHLDAAEFDADRDAVRQAAHAAGVQTCVIPAVAVDNFETVRRMGHQYQDVYALGIHPLYTPQASEVKNAREIIAALKAANEMGKGTVVVNDKLVERHHVRAAERLLKLSEMISTLEESHV